jgi:4-amino-4-deoxy-L-arabinose transferase-like glycosyltransferase
VSRLYLQPSTLAKRLWLLLFILIGAFYLWGLGSLPFVGPDEPRYAEVGREMFARHDWITPTLGGMSWFEKPALLYWMMIVSYRVFGVSEFAARLGPALCGLLGAVFVYWIGRAIAESTATEHPAGSTSKIDGQAIACWSTFVYLSSLGMIVFSRGVNFDVVLTMTVTGALACFFSIDEQVATTETDSSAVSNAWLRWDWSLLALAGFHFFTGLSLLAKGLAGYVIIFGTLFLYYSITRKRPRRRFIVSFLWGVPLSLAVAATWYGPMIARHGYTFIDQFIIQHHFARFATNKYHHPQPIFFYPIVLSVLVLPWAIALVGSLFSTRRWNWRGAASIDRARALALAWLIVPLVFFSVSRSKLPGYILPVLPACALLIGERIACFCREHRGEKVIRATGVLLIVPVMIGAWYATRDAEVQKMWVVIAGLLPALAGIVAVIRPKLRATVFMLVGIAVIASSALSLRFVAPTVAANESVRDALAMADARGYRAWPVVQLHTVERTAEFYAAGRIIYGKDGEPVKLEGANQVIEVARQSGGRVLCFVPTKYLTQLMTLPNAQAEIVGGNARVSLVALMTAP